MRSIKYIIFSLLIILLPSYAMPVDNETEQNILRKINENKKFENAVHFIKLQEYDRALEEFKEYLEIYNNGIHRYDSYINIAEIYFNRFNYIRSIDAYKSLYEEFSGTEEGVEAYFKMSICYLKMGYHDKARDIFNSIIEEHPDSNYASLSRVNLDLLDILDDKNK